MTAISASHPRGGGWTLHVNIKKVIYVYTSLPTNAKPNQVIFDMNAFHKGFQNVSKNQFSTPKSMI